MWLADTLTTGLRARCEKWAAEMATFAAPSTHTLDEGVTFVAPHRTIEVARDWSEKSESWSEREVVVDHVGYALSGGKVFEGFWPIHLVQAFEVAPRLQAAVVGLLSGDTTGVDALVTFANETDALRARCAGAPDKIRKVLSGREHISAVGVILESLQGAEMKLNPESAHWECPTLPLPLVVEDLNAGTMVSFGLDSTRGRLNETLEGYKTLMAQAKALRDANPEEAFDTRPEARVIAAEIAGSLRWGAGRSTWGFSGGHNASQQTVEAIEDAMKYVLYEACRRLEGRAMSKELFKAVRAIQGNEATRPELPRGWGRQIAAECLALWQRGEVRRGADEWRPWADAKGVTL